MKPTKKMSSNKQSHVPNTKLGMGDYYGSGVRAKIGKMRDGLGMATLSKKKLGTPPKSVA